MDIVNVMCYICGGNNSENLLYGGKGHDAYERGGLWGIKWAPEFHY